MTTTIAAFERRVAYIGEHLMAAAKGSYASQEIIRRESYTTSDFPAVFQVINNQVIASAWDELEPGLWTKIAKPLVVDNLQRQKRRTFRPDTSMLTGLENGGQVNIAGALPAVGELGLYPGIGFQTTEADIGVAKHGVRIGFSWEAFKSDDYGQILSLPPHMLEMARTTEDVKLFNKLFTAGNWNPGIFGLTSANAGNYQRLPGNPALTRDSLLLALARARTFDPANSVGTDGQTNQRVGRITKWVLVVPQALETTAEVLLSATNLRVTEIDGDTEVQMDVPNLLAGKFEILVVPYIEQFVGGPDGGVKDTMWGIFPAGGNGSNADTMFVAKLRGQETPQLRITNDQGLAFPGGGSLGQFEGSFDRDEIQIRARYFVDGAVNDINGIVVSRGTGLTENVVS